MRSAWKLNQIFLKVFPNRQGENIKLIHISQNFVRSISYIYYLFCVVLCCDIKIRNFKVQIIWNYMVSENMNYITRWILNIYGEWGKRLFNNWISWESRKLLLSILFQFMMWIVSYKWTINKAMKKLWSSN